MKGMELPINVLVIVAIAVIVLLGMIAVYFIGFNPFGTTTSIEAAKTNGCRDYMHQYPNACNNSVAINMEYPPGTPITLDDFTDAYYKCNITGSHIEQCTRRVCGCPYY